MSDAPSDPAAGPSRPSLPLQPLQNPRFRHVSRSAAKRESVQLLGSIKDLQAHFSRALNVEHKPGAGVGVKGLGTLGEEDEENHEPHATGLHGGAGVPKPRLKERRPWKEVELPRIEPEAAKEELKGVLANVRGLWSIQADSTSPPGTGVPAASPVSAGGMTRSPTIVKLSSEIDARHMLVSTAQAVRRVRELSLALISQPGRRVSGPNAPPRTGSNPGKVPRQSISTPSRPNVSVVPRVSSASTQLPARKSSLGLGVIGEVESDYLVDLRKAALEVLAGLRSLEERLRVTASEVKQDSEVDVEHPGPGITSNDTLGIDTAGPNARRRSSTSLLPSPADSRPSSSLSGLMSEPESYTTTTGTTSTAHPETAEEEDDFDLNLLAADVDLHKHLQTWEERILSESRTYRQPRGDEGLREREGVRWWIGVVEGLFLREGKVQGDGQDRGKWVDDAEWEGKELERVYEFLTSDLPLDVELLLPSPAQTTFRAAFLNRLSDGYILLIALNASLHVSPKPWGFVSPSDMYDTLLAGGSEEEGGEGGGDWTFRRVGNLTAWAAAIRHRFSIPLTLPPSSTSGPLSYLQSAPLPSIRDPSRHKPAGRPIAQPIPKGPAQVAPPAQRSKREVEEPGIIFDPLTIARRAEGWEATLEGVLVEWVQRAAEEVRTADKPRDTGREGRSVSGGSEGSAGASAQAERGGWL